MPLHHLKTISCSIFLALLAACGGSNTSPPEPAQSGQMNLAAITAQPADSGLAADWYRDAVFMEIYLRGYQDSDGDGTGDIDGLIARLPYLKSLGVKGIWLMPIFATNHHDHGYDVMDHRKLETEFGDDAALKRLIDAAHAEGMGVILDYVMNHSARANPLFHDSANSLEGKRNWYVWQAQQPDWWWGTNPWRQDGSKPQYYYAGFADFMPDFNLRNEEVINYHLSSMRHWLNLGVDGFRMDAVQAFVENGYDTENQPETLALLQRIRNTIDEYPNRFMVCEDVPNPQLAVDSGCTSAFYFGLHSALINSAKNGTLDSRLASLLADPHISQLSVFLSNHDTFAGDRIYDQLGGDMARYQLATTSLLTLPGIPFVYYGDEIGASLATKAEIASHDQALRPPMSWTADPQTAGFTTGTAFRVPVDNVATHNVAAAEQDANSILVTYRQLIALRNSEAALRRGDIVPLASGDDAVLAFTRNYQGENLLVVINYANSAKTLPLTVPQANSQWQLRHPASGSDVSADGTGQITLSLPALSARIYKRH